MERNYLVKLTKTLYRVSDFFPEKEPLKFLMREQANKILADWLLVFPETPATLSKEERNRILFNISKNVEIIQAYFEVARAQNWVKEENFLVLEGEYNKICLEVRPRSDLGLTLDERRVRGLKQRQKRILQVLQDRQTTQVKDLKKIFPEVTKRTIRRDFDELLKRGLVERLGSQNKVIYKLSGPAVGLSRSDLGLT